MYFFIREIILICVILFIIYADDIRLSYFENISSLPLLKELIDLVNLDKSVGFITPRGSEV